MSKRKTPKPVRSDAEIEKLVEDNMRLAWFFVAKYAAWHPDEQERLSYAMKGLYEAAVNWEPSLGIPFGTYASKRINWQYHRIRTGDNRVKRGGGKITFVPIDFELDGKALHDIIEDENAPSPFGSVIKSEQAIKLYELMPQLPERERFILERRFGASNYEPHTLEEISHKMGITRERVRQIEQEALGRLRCLYNGEPFRWDHKNKTDHKGNKTSSAGATKSAKMTKWRWAHRRKTR